MNMKGIVYQSSLCRRLNAEFIHQQIRDIAESVVDGLTFLGQLSLSGTSMSTIMELLQLLLLIFGTLGFLYIATFHLMVTHPYTNPKYGF